MELRHSNKGFEEEKLQLKVELIHKRISNDLELFRNDMKRQPSEGCKQTSMHSSTK